MKNYPSSAFVMSSWFALVSGAAGFLIGLWNSELQLNEQGFFFTVLMYGLFAAVTVQKSVRDKAEGIPVTNMFSGISWCSAILAVLLLGVGVFNAQLLLSEKGFYIMSFILSLFGAITVQKNVRDLQQPAQSEDVMGTSISENATGTSISESLEAEQAIT